MSRLHKYSKGKFFRPFLIKARIEQGYSQRELARLLGVDRRTVLAWERGEYSPRDTMKLNIMECLGVGSRKKNTLFDIYKNPFHKDGST